jgi:nucleoside-diphosphate-sugar epimerase
MDVFVAGGTGVLGRAALQALVQAGHRVRSSARSKEKSDLIRSLGAEPVDLDLYDPASLRKAVAGCNAVLRLTTKIPALMKMRNANAWLETNRLRTEGARLLVDAAIAEHVSIYVHESVTAVYRDGGTGWLTEDAPTDDGGKAILRAALAGEGEAQRFSNSGGSGIVLRFGGFYGPDAPSTPETISLAKKRMLFRVGTAANYFSSIYVADAGRSVAAALNVTSGIYNVCDDEPAPFADILQMICDAARAPHPLHLPGFLGPWLYGSGWSYISRSLRVSNARLKQHSTWAPVVRSASQGWPLVMADLERAAHAKSSV